MSPGRALTVELAKPSLCVIVSRINQFVLKDVKLTER